MTKTYTCPAEKLIDTSSLIKVGGYLLHNWNLEDIADLENLFENDGIALDFSYTDDEGYIFEFEFAAEALKNAVISGNSIKLIDNQGAEAEIECFNLTPNCI